MIQILNSSRAKVLSFYLSIHIKTDLLILGGELVEVDDSLFEDMLDLELDEAATTGIDLSDVEQ